MPKRKKHKKSFTGWMPDAKWHKFWAGIPFYTTKKDCMFEQEQKAIRVRIIIEEV